MMSSRGQAKRNGLRLLGLAASAMLVTAALCGCKNYSFGKRFDLLRKKWRLSAPKSYEPITFQQIVELVPSCPFDESQGTAIDLQERRGVTLEGYLIRVEQLEDGKTYAHVLRRGDTHLEIAASAVFNPESGESQRVICEMTVPFQWRHRKWNLEGLAPLAGLVRDDLTGHTYPGGTLGGTRVRISGYLLDDFVHCLTVGWTRATAWEIHPITKFEVFDEKRKEFVAYD